jgi:hypothetical protein
MASGAYPGAGVPNSTGSAWGTSYTVGAAANNLVQLDSSARLPAVSAALLTNFPTLNQNTTGTAGGLAAQYIDWNASSGGNSIANKPSLGAMASGAYPGSGITVSTGSAWGTSLTAPSGAIVGTSDAQALTNKRINPRASSTTSETSWTVDADSYDVAIQTALAGALTVNAPSGTPVAGQKLIIRLTDNGTARGISWNGIFRASSDLALPTTTVLSKTLYCGFIYNSTASKWDLVAKLDNF